MKFSPGIFLVLRGDLSGCLNWEVFSAFRTLNFPDLYSFGNNELDNSIALHSRNMWDVTDISNGWRYKHSLDVYIFAPSRLLTLASDAGFTLEHVIIIVVSPACVFLNRRAMLPLRPNLLTLIGLLEFCTNWHAWSPPPRQYTADTLRVTSLSLSVKNARQCQSRYRTWHGAMALRYSISSRFVLYFYYINSCCRLYCALMFKHTEHIMLEIPSEVFFHLIVWNFALKPAERHGLSVEVSLQCFLT